MKKKLKGILCLVLICALMLPSFVVFAADNTTSPIAELSLDDVKTLVKKNSANRDSYELQESIYSLARKNTLESLAELDTNSEYWLGKMQEAEASGNMVAYNTYYQYYSALEKAYQENAPSVEDALNQVNDALDDLDRQMADFDMDLDLMTTLIYSNILELEDSRELMEANLNLLIKNRNIVWLQQKMGMATDLDYANVNQQINSLTQSITALNSGITSLKRTLNNFMGFDLDFQFNLKPWDVSVSVDSVVPTITAEMIETALKNDLTLEQLDRKMDYAKSDIRNSVDDSEKASYRNDLKGLELQYDNQVTTVKNTLTSYRAAVVNAQNAYVNAQAAYDIAKRDLEIAQLKYDLGMISAIQMDSSKASFKQAENTLISARHDCYFAKVDYELYQKGTILTMYSTIKKTMQ